MKSVGLQVNGEKTKYMLSSLRASSQERVEVVNNFSDNKITSEDKQIIMLANRCLYGLSKLMRSKLISRKTKVRLYHQLIIPVLLYGSEGWALKATTLYSDEELLAVFEKRILVLFTDRFARRVSGE